MKKIPKGCSNASEAHNSKFKPTQKILSLGVQSTTAQVQDGVTMALVENRQGSEWAMLHCLLKKMLTPWTEWKMAFLCLPSISWALHPPCFARSKQLSDKGSTQSVEVVVLSTQFGHRLHKSFSREPGGNTWRSREDCLGAASGDTVCCLRLHEPEDSNYGQRVEPQENRLHSNTEAEICNGKNYQNRKRHEKGKGAKHYVLYCVHELFIAA